MKRRFYIIPTFYIVKHGFGFCWLLWDISFARKDNDGEDKELDYYHKIAEENRF